MIFAALALWTPAVAASDPVAPYAELLAAGRARTAADGLHALLQAGLPPDQESRARVHLGSSLLALELPVSAERVLARVVQKGPGDPGYDRAVALLVTAAAAAEDDTLLTGLIDGIDPRQFTGAVAAHLELVAGRRRYARGDLGPALRHLRRVPSDRAVAPRARLLEAVILQQRGERKSAAVALHQVLSSPQATDELRALARLDLARLYFEVAKLPAADRWYASVPQGSSHGPDAMFERAWTLFLAERPNRALGLLLAVRSPHFAGSEFLPEAQYLRALIAYTLCEHRAAEALLERLEAELGPLTSELGRILDEGAPEVLVEQWRLEPDPSLPEGLRERLQRRRDVAVGLERLDRIDAERARIESAGPAWRQGVGAWLGRELDRDAARTRKRAGRALLQEVAAARTEVQSLAHDAAVLRFEIVDAERVELEHLTIVPDLGTVEDRTVDYATDPRTIYWPFNGEFWWDELGGYRYTEHGRCSTTP